MYFQAPDPKYLSRSPKAEPLGHDTEILSPQTLSKHQVPHPMPRVLQRYKFIGNIELCPSLGLRDQRLPLHKYKDYPRNSKPHIAKQANHVYQDARGPSDPVIFKSCYPESQTYLSVLQQHFRRCLGDLCQSFHEEQPKSPKP